MAGHYGPGTISGTYHSCENYLLTLLVRHCHRYRILRQPESPHLTWYQMLGVRSYGLYLEQAHANRSRSTLRTCKCSKQKPSSTQTEDICAWHFIGGQLRVLRYHEMLCLTVKLVIGSVPIWMVESSIENMSVVDPPRAVFWRLDRESMSAMAEIYPLGRKLRHVNPCLTCYIGRASIMSLGSFLEEQVLLTLVMGS